MGISRMLIKDSINERYTEPSKVPINGKDFRMEVERRKFSYTLYIPERRSGKDRRQDGQVLKD
jgi:hypothetical protein